MMMPAQKLLDRLDKVRSLGKSSYMACCPAHDDRSPSLSIKECDDGRLLVHCFAGCPTTDVLDAVGLSLADLFPVEMKSKHHTGQLPHGKRLRLQQAADYERTVLAIIGADAANGAPIDAERAAIAKDNLRKIQRVLNG